MKPNLLLASALASALLMSAGAQAETITIGGTGAALGTMHRLAEAFTAAHPDITIDIPPSLGSGGGIKALGKGALDLAVSTRPPNPNEGADRLSAVPFAKTAVVFAVHGEVERRAATTSQLVALFSGSQQNWENGAPVRLIMRPHNESDTKLIVQVFSEMKPVIDAALKAPGLPVANTDQQMADMIERTDGAIGFTALSVFQSENRPVHLLRLNGVMPSPYSITNGSYPLVKTLYFVVPQNARDGVVRFLRFAASAKGKEIIERAGSAALEMRSASAPHG
jgi:phosphate transport system substrate-binding protein